MLWIGIDTGTETGLAIWDSKLRMLLSLEKVTILEAMDTARQIIRSNPGNVRVRIEDARLRRHGGWIPREGSHREAIGRAIGAGMVMRDCHIWEEFLKAERVPFECVAPKDNTTKLSADAFKSFTGWKKRTNEHERDAAMLVFGR